MSLGEVQKREGEYKTAEGATLAAQAALTAAENKLHLWGMGEAEVQSLIKSGEIRPRYSVRAPLAGCVIEREATLGEIVGPSLDALLILADMKTLWVLADVPEAVIHEVSMGSSATVTVDAVKDQRFAGRVTYIAPSLDKATRTAQVRIEVADGHTPLRPGMFAHVKLILSAPAGRGQEPVLAVPESAVQIVEGGPAVFVEVEGEPNTFAKQAVTVGPAIGQMVPLLSGLAEGRRFVSGGTFVLKAELAKGIMEGKTCSGH
jgi:cobalt-zinc-cadmium efflux system membrane fusion protein